MTDTENVLRIYFIDDQWDGRIGKYTLLVINGMTGAENVLRIYFMGDQCDDRH